MKDYYLSSPSEASLKKDISQIPELVDENGDFIFSSPLFAQDYVGRVITEPGKYDLDGKLIENATWTEKVHLNIRV